MAFLIFTTTRPGRCVSPLCPAPPRRWRVVIFIGQLTRGDDGVHVLRQRLRLVERATTIETSSGKDIVSARTVRSVAISALEGPNFFESSNFSSRCPHLEFIAIQSVERKGKIFKGI